MIMKFNLTALKKNVSSLSAYIHITRRSVETPSATPRRRRVIILSLPITIPTYWYPLRIALRVILVDGALQSVRQLVARQVLRLHQILPGVKQDVRSFRRLEQMQTLLRRLAHGTVVELVPARRVFGEGVVVAGIDARAVVHHRGVEVEEDAGQTYSIVQVDALKEFGAGLRRRVVSEVFQRENQVGGRRYYFGYSFAIWNKNFEFLN